MKINLLFFALLAVFLVTGAVLAQSRSDEVGFDITQLISEETVDLLNAPTGNMTDEIALEIIARIYVCHKGDNISEEEFNGLKAPYDINTVEFSAYYIKRLYSGSQSTSQFLEMWESRMPGLVADVEAGDCKFTTQSEQSTIEQCNGFCSVDEVCPIGSTDKGSNSCQPQEQCHSCGFLGLKKCCDYLPTICCEYPKPVEDCSTGLCTYNDCPEGTQIVGSANCGEVEDCKPCWWGLTTCCEKKTTKCCMAINNTKCNTGTCQDSATCPDGFKNIGMADCGSYQNTYSCGFLGHIQCQDPAPKTCCVPE